MSKYSPEVGGRVREVPLDHPQGVFSLETEVETSHIVLPPTWCLKLRLTTGVQSNPLPRISDEAHFWLNGYVNKQNYRIWSEANPQVYVETPLHPEKLTVWCALWAGGIIGPYFFKNDEGHNNNHDVQELWFQQDGATCHTARATIDLLKDTFGDRLISRFGPVNWPPRSCDLTPLEYFLWGYVKSLVYVDKPQTLDHLEDNIRRVIADIRPQMLEKVIENWTTSEPAVAVLCQKSYLKYIVGRVAQYVDEHYPVDKWHLGDLIAWVAQSALKYRPRICELSKCLRTTKDDRVSQEIAPNTVTPCEIAVCRSTFGPLAGAPPDTCAVVIITETESGFITEDDTPSLHTSLPVVGKNPVDTAYDVGSVVSVLADVGSSIVSLWFLLMALDVWKEVSGVESICRSGHSSDCTILAIICVPGTSCPSATVHSPFCDPLLPTPSNYHIAPTEVAADTSIRPTCFSEAYNCRRLRLRGILSLISSIKVIRFVWIAVRRSYSCF
ncbi:transposable element Tc3 transposase [Trichonephila clavipes]|nr:transposable element Tc3 transposase [Trichonephila clavipes]